MTLHSTDLRSCGVEYNTARAQAGLAPIKGRARLQRGSSGPVTAHIAHVVYTLEVWDDMEDGFRGAPEPR